MIVFEDVTLFGRDGKSFLKNFSTVIKKGEKVSLVGASGAGKSSLLRCVVGGVANWQGKITVNQLPVSAPTIHSIRNVCGYIPQEPRLPANSVEDFLDEFFSGFKFDVQDEFKIKVNDLCRSLLLPEDILEHDCRKLSGGQRQRLVIASVAALERKIILADEVSSALDKESKRRVMNLLFEKSHTILSVSHDPEWCERCDRIIDITKKEIGDERGA